MARPPPLPSARIRVRMYRVGFGDCFLVTLPGPEREHHLLVDCGVHPGGDAGTMDAVVDDVAAASGGRLDVVVATHAHRDHVSGFGTHAARFSRLAVSEVWMPWTEDPSDLVATRLGARQRTLVEKLSRHFATLRGRRFDAVRATVLNLAPDPEALAQLRGGFRDATVRYLRAGAQLGAPAGIAGLAVTILGPSAEPAFVARLDPPAGLRYLRAAESSPALVDAVRPFARHWLAGPGDRGPRLTATERRELTAVAGDPATALAVAIDRAVNETSLVALLRYRGRSLLFPGDAPLARGQAWVSGPDGVGVLPSLDLYKVSQHGGARANPTSALERMASPRLAAMVSTRSRPWAAVPDPRVLADLGRCAGRGVFRSDSPRAAGSPRGAAWVDCELPVAGEADSPVSPVPGTRARRGGRARRR